MLALIVMAMVLPWRGSVFAPGLLRAERQVTVMTAEPGRLTEVTRDGHAVTAGQTLFSLDNPDIAHDAAFALVEIAGLKARLMGQSFDAAAAADVPVAWQQLEGAVARLRDAQARQAQMDVRAPFSGRLLDVPREIEPGVWLPKREPLGILVDPSAMIVEALVNESDIGRIRQGDSARFRPENDEAAIPLVVRDVSPGASPLVTTPELASVHGGGVPVRRESDGRLKPETAVYRVTFGLPDGLPVSFGARRGTVRIDATPVSLVNRMWRRAAAVVMREAGL